MSTDAYQLTFLVSICDVSWLLCYAYVCIMYVYVCVYMYWCGFIHYTYIEGYIYIHI